jgi:flagellar biosynthetic protein FliR
MTINLLDHYLISQVLAFMLIFCRLGSALMLMPGFGEVYVSPRTRLLFALTFSLLMLPLQQANMPTMPGSPLMLTLMVVGEILIGTFLGLIARAILSTMHVAGNIIASQSSLAVAAVFDPSAGGQSPVVSNMLTLVALTLFFALDLHHLLLAALVESYDVFPVAQLPSAQDMNILHVRIVADAFTLGVMLAAPHIVFSLLFYLGGGLMNRLMPNFQVFFIMMPPQIMIAFLLLLAALPLMLDSFAHFMEEQFLNFVGTGS